MGGDSSDPKAIGACLAGYSCRDRCDVALRSKEPHPTPLGNASQDQHPILASVRAPSPARGAWHVLANLFGLTESLSARMLGTVHGLVALAVLMWQRHCEMTCTLVPVQRMLLRCRSFVAGNTCNSGRISEWVHSNRWLP